MYFFQMSVAAVAQDKKELNMHLACHGLPFLWCNEVLNNKYEHNVNQHMSRI